MNTNPNIPVSQLPVDAPRPAQTTTAQETVRPVEAPDRAARGARETRHREHRGLDGSEQRSSTQQAEPEQRDTRQDATTTAGGQIDTYA